VGIHREQFFTHGRWHDIWIGEILREDWERANPS
jgi:RimJ/RimL family protein N-acetyltransferase